MIVTYLVFVLLSLNNISHVIFKSKVVHPTIFRWAISEYFIEFLFFSIGPCSYVCNNLLACRWESLTQRVMMHRVYFPCWVGTHGINKKATGQQRNQTTWSKCWRYVYLVDLVVPVPFAKTSHWFQFSLWETSSWAYICFEVPTLGRSTSIRKGWGDDSLGHQMHLIG